MSPKKTKWFEVGEDEEIQECLNRMAFEGYTVIGRKEEPLFQEKNGELIPIRQIIHFKGQLQAD